MPHPLAHHRLPGIGPMRQARLEEAGIRTLEQLLATPVDAIAVLPGFHGALAARAHAAALTVLESAPPELVDVVEVEDPSPVQEPAAVATSGWDRIDPALRRGLDVARRIEETRGWVRTVRARLKVPKKTGGRSKRRKRVPFEAERNDLRQELRRLVKALGKVQREAITTGLSEMAAADLDRVLAKIERRLEKFSDRPLDVDRIVKLAGRMARARRALHARVT